MRFPVGAVFAATLGAACLGPLPAVAGGNEGGLISKAINDAMARGAAPVGSVIPCYVLPPGSPPGMTPGIGSFTECVLVPKAQAGQIAVPSALPAAPYGARHAGSGGPLPGWTAPGQ